MYMDGKFYYNLTISSGTNLQLTRNYAPAYIIRECAYKAYEDDNDGGDDVDKDKDNNNINCNYNNFGNDNNIDIANDHDICKGIDNDIGN